VVLQHLLLLHLESNLLLEGELNTTLLPLLFFLLLQLGSGGFLEEVPDETEMMIDHIFNIIDPLLQDKLKLQDLVASHLVDVAQLLEHDVVLVLPLRVGRPFHEGTIPVEVIPEVPKLGHCPLMEHTKALWIELVQQVITKVRPGEPLLPNFSEQLHS